MIWIILSVGLSFAGWIAYELYRSPVIEDENDTLNDDPTVSCWDDNKNHTEGNF